MKLNIIERRYKDILRIGRETISRISQHSVNHQTEFTRS